jgi:hypothetical protein
MSSLLSSSLFLSVLVESSLGLAALLWGFYGALAANLLNCNVNLISFGIEADLPWCSNCLSKLHADESYYGMLLNLVERDSLRDIERISKSERCQLRLSTT